MCLTPGHACRSSYTACMRSAAATTSGFSFPSKGFFGLRDTLECMRWGPYWESACAGHTRFQGTEGNDVASAGGTEPGWGGVGGFGAACSAAYVLQLLHLLELGHDGVVGH
jgi:hypothetical protein